MIYDFHWPKHYVIFSTFFLLRSFIFPCKTWLWKNTQRKKVFLLNFCYNYKYDIINLCILKCICTNMYNIAQHMDENIFAFELKKKRKTGHIFIHIHTYIHIKNYIGYMKLISNIFKKNYVYLYFEMNIKRKCYWHV